MPEAPGKTVSDLALQAAAKGPFPAVVCFVNMAPRSDPRTIEGRLTQTVIRDSTSVTLMLTDPRIGDDLTLALRMFRVLKVDVGRTEPADSPAVNKGKAPFLAVLDVEGKVVGVLGPGIPSKPQVLDLLKKAVAPRMTLESNLEKERKLVQDIMRHDSLEADLRTKRANLEASKGANPKALVHFEDDIRRLEAESAAALQSIGEQEDRIEKELVEKGLKPGPKAPAKPEKPGYAVGPSR